MEFRKINAILRSHALNDVEKRLKEMDVKGITVTRVKGLGEEIDLLRENSLVPHARIEIFTEKTKAEKIANAIMEAAHTGGPGDGIVCILPVEKVFRIRTKSEATLDEV